MAEFSKNVPNIMHLQVVAQAMLKEENCQNQQSPAGKFNMTMFNFDDNALMVTTSAGTRYN
jgi:hypothetical protein